MILIEQIRAARALLGLKQNELAAKAGISTGTLNNIERGFQKDPKLSTLKAIQQALRNEGIEFTEDSDGTIGIRYKLKAKAGVSNILIIDDNKGDRLLYKTWLNKYPDGKFRIFEAADARSGYEAFLQHSPDCIILDFMMYGKTGFQLLVQMKQDHVRVPPIIFVTAMHSDMVSKDALELGVQVALDKKTLTKEKLYEEIKKAVS